MRNFSHMVTLRAVAQPSDYRLSHTLLAYWRGLLAMARALLGSLPHPDFADAEVRTAYLILLATVARGTILDV